ncbi:MAG: cupin, partial [Planctomycetales bacterium]|nr:cupin [Planctomycetales bacterium]
ATDHGLVLGENGVLYDTKKGEALPEGVGPMPLLTEEELKAYPEVPVDAVIGTYVARYWDLMALGADKPATVIGEGGIIKDKPGFEVDFLTRGSAVTTATKADKPVVLMPVRGHWRIKIDDVEVTLSGGDTALVMPGESYIADPSMTGEASLYRITATDDPAGATWTGN